MKSEAAVRGALDFDSNRNAGLLALCATPRKIDRSHGAASQQRRVAYVYTG